MTEQEKAGRFAQMAPQLSRAETDAINALFPTYIFRRSRTGEVWTSCCRRHETLGMARNQEEYYVMTASHQREPENRWQEAPKASAACPFCGRPAIIKELGRTGKRDNLRAYRRAVVLRWHRGALWARAYDCKKVYSTGYDLTREPECKLVGVYRFRPGLAEATTRDWYGNDPFRHIRKQDGPLTKGRWNIHGPFNANAEYGVGYDVIGLEEIQKSPFRYCMAEEAERKFTKFLEFLTACCFYPRQIEMLMKAGISDVVRDLAERGVKHAAVINWGEPNPAKALGLNRQDLKIFLGTDRDIQILELHKKLKGRVPLATCAEWMTRGLDIRETFQAAKKWNLPPERLIRYLDSKVGCARYGGMSTLSSALHYWGDYLTAAEAMTYPLHRENVLLPRNLGEAHDKATGEHREKLARERAAQDRERKHRWEAAEAERIRKIQQAEKNYEKLREKLEKKYGFSMDGYVIRVPMGKDEILAEGRQLQHCVGGYAERHIKGKTTILFMRKVQRPDESWLTIEMNGNELRQIHGYRNEGEYTQKGRFAPDPRDIYREFLDTWLDWLKKGSKRDKHGDPKITRKKKGAAA